MNDPFGCGNENCPASINQSHGLRDGHGGGHVCKTAPWLSLAMIANAVSLGEQAADQAPDQLPNRN